MFKKFGFILIALTMCLALGSTSANAVPVQIAPGGIGDVLMTSLYDVRLTADRTLEGWQNYFVIENTSGLWTAAHVRFRSWRKSIEVFDHVILLSPYDVFWAVIERVQTGDDAGNVKIWSDDTETLRNSGLIYPPETHWETNFQSSLLEDCGFTEAYLAGVGSSLNEEMQAGYLEVIGLWQLQVADAPVVEDTHSLGNVVADVYDDSHPGNINVYDCLDALFYDINTDPDSLDWPGVNCDQATVAGFLNDFVIIEGNEVAGGGVARYGIDCGNVLAGGFQMGDITNGRLEFGNFLALADFRTNLTNVTTGAGHRDAYTPGAIVFNTDIMFWIPAVDPSPYLNESWATTVGPGLRDGDDIDFPMSDGNNRYPGVDLFNDVWSLDDVERTGLWRNNLWYHYYVDAYGANYKTDVVLTFPTKHYHYYFKLFPWWNDTGIFATIQEYWLAVELYRDGIAEDFMDDFDNGPVDAGRYVWNMEQDLPEGKPGEPPPGSPWHPTWSPKDPIPHEVNIIRVGAEKGTGHGITDAYGFLDTDYDMGHFTIVNPALRNGDRFWANCPVVDYPYNAQPYALPPIGEVIFILQYGDGFYRSTCAQWHYTTDRD